MLLTSRGTHAVLLFTSVFQARSEELCSNINRVLLSKRVKFESVDVCIVFTLLDTVANDTSALCTPMMAHEYISTPPVP